MRKWLAAVLVLLCMTLIFTLPTWAEGGEVLPPVEESEGAGDGASAAPPPMEDAETPEAGGASPSTTEDEGGDGPSGSPVPTEKEDAEWSMEDIKAYINNTVVPAAVMVVTALAALYVALVPVFHRVKAVIAKFNTASDEITATASESAQTKKNTNEALDKLAKEYAQLLSQNEQLRACYAALERFVKGALGEMQQSVTGKMDEVSGKAEQIEKMLIVGFCNNRELVEKGYAKQIALLGASVDMTGTVRLGEPRQEAGDGASLHCKLVPTGGRRGPYKEKEKEEGNEQDGIEGEA